MFVNLAPVTLRIRRILLQLLRETCNSKAYIQDPKQESCEEKRLHGSFPKLLFPKWRNLYRAPYYNGNPNIGPRIIGNLDQSHIESQKQLHDCSTPLSPDQPSSWRSGGFPSGVPFLAVPQKQGLQHFGIYFGVPLREILPHVWGKAHNRD